MESYKWIPYEYPKMANLAITDNEQYYACQVGLDIMKFLIPEGHFCSISGGLYPVKGNNNCVLASYFNNNWNNKMSCSISVQHVPRNYRTQWSLNDYLMAVMQYSTIECKHPGYTKSRHIIPALAIIIIQEACSIFTPDFIIPVISSFASKMPKTLWACQFEPFLKLFLTPQST